MFRAVPLSVIRSFSLYTQQWHVIQVFLTAYKQDQENVLMMDRGPVRNMWSFLPK